MFLRTRPVRPTAPHSSPNARSVLVAAASLAILSLASHSVALAQSQTVVTAAHGASCLDTLSLAGAKPWIAYVAATVRDSTPAPFPELADEFTQAVAQHLRKLLNARGDTLPRADPSMGWRDFPAGPLLTVHTSRDHEPSFTLDSSVATTTAAGLLLRAATESQSDGDGALFWPQDAVIDSLDFRIGYRLSTDGSFANASDVRYAFPVFSLMRPATTPAAMIEEPEIHYPASARELGGTGYILVQLEVDSTGHITPGTVREVWPPGQARPTGALYAVYADFLQAVMNGLPSARFSPARVGGCAVNQLVQLPFTFDLQ